MTIIDMDALRESAPRLHRVVLKHLGGQDFGVRDIDLFALPQFTRGELFGWVTEHEFQKRLKAVKQQPAAPVVEKPGVPQIDMAELEREEQAAIHKSADETSARNRLNEYATAGLENTQQNAAASKQWLQDNVKGYLSEQGVDLAVQWLGPRGKNVLTLRKQEAPPPPPTPEPMIEVLEPLPNGEPRIPLDAQPTKQHSTAQLKDYLARLNAGKLIRPRGGFSSKFV
jgi:hypothetical protein